MWPFTDVPTFMSQNWALIGPLLVIMLFFKLNPSALSKKRKSLEDEVVLITGASSGIGESLAAEFYKRGAKVILVSRRRSELERVKNELLESNVSGSRALHVLDMDVSDLNLIERKVEEAFKIHGRIDILVHNAGVLSRAEVIDSKLSLYQDVMQVNYFGVVALTKAVLPKMLEAKKGHIVSISSVQGRIAIPRRSAYAASKHALVAFMDSLRAEIADSGVQVTCVHPSYVRTNIAHASLTANGDVYGMADPNIKGGYEADDVAEEICDAVQGNAQDLVIAPFVQKLLIYSRTICPALYFYVLESIAKSPKYY